MSFFESISQLCNVYLTRVDEASCRLLIMLGNGRCTVLGDEVFSQRIDPMLLQEIFQTDFLIIIIIMMMIIIIIIIKEKKNLPAGSTPETHTLCKQVVAEYLNVWSR